MRIGRTLALPLCLVALWTAAWPFTIDDAGITARYAVRLARGLGYTFNPGAVTDGVTGPLWLAPGVLGAWLGVDPLAAAKATGALASAASVVLVWLRLRGRTLGRPGTEVALLVAATSLPLVAWAAAGLESGAAALCATWLALAVTARPAPSPRSAGLACATLAWLRPELLVAAAVLLVALAVRTRRGAALAGALALTGVLALVAFRYAMFGHALPLSLDAKPALLSHGLGYVGALLARPRAIAALALVALGLTRGGRAELALAAALVAQLAGFALAGGDWMPGFRLVAPLVPMFALLAGSTLPRLALFRPRLAALVLAALVASGALEVARELPALRAAGLTQRARLSPLARAVCGARAPVALVDVGVLGLACPDQPLIDLGGLTEPAIARARGGHLAKQVDAGWLEARAPAMLVLHSREAPRVDDARRLRWFAGYPVERRVLSFAWVGERYRVNAVYTYAPDYHYVLLRPAR